MRSVFGGFDKDLNGGVGHPGRHGRDFPPCFPVWYPPAARDRPAATVLYAHATTYNSTTDHHTHAARTNKSARSQQRRAPAIPTRPLDQGTGVTRWCSLHRCMQSRPGARCPCSCHVDAMLMHRCIACHAHADAAQARRRSHKRIKTCNIKACNAHAGSTAPLAQHMPAHMKWRHTT